MSQDVTSSSSVEEKWKKLRHKFFFKSTPPSEDEISVLKDEIEKHKFFKIIVKSGQNIHQTTAPQAVLEEFIRFVRGSSSKIENGFEYIRYGLEIKDSMFVEECCLNCSSLKIPEGASAEFVIRVFTTFVETVPLRDLRDYGVIFEELSSWEEATSSEVVDRICNIIEEKKNVEVSVSPVPIFTSRITVAVLSMLPVGDRVTALITDNGWEPLKLFGEQFCPGEVDGDFHLVFSKYILLLTAEKKILKRDLKTSESSIVFEDADYFRSHFGKCLVISGGKLFLWNEKSVIFEERYSDPKNRPVSACADSDSDEIRVKCFNGNSIDILDNRMTSWLERAKYFDCDSGKCERHFIENGKWMAEWWNDGLKFPLRDFKTHFGWTTVTVSKTSGGVYIAQQLPGEKETLSGQPISFSDVHLRL